ncbi:hypothetical protein [Botrimarina hoheduenensis]|uniref:Uncharacterized protein n=1 Tax=Botrimarina hoheduenensis TaxID=2528000 RepID=A0A5C5WA69_9BACT|nr:hypothetical protein [Botrimarina hoheduenensis]TWT47193.1 hypothetical protein Pla111_08050 [Botrimarina hoheduenensis]
MADRSKKLFEALVRENEGALTAYLRAFVRDPGLADDLFKKRSSPRGGSLTTLTNRSRSAHGSGVSR